MLQNIAFDPLICAFAFGFTVTELFAGVQPVISKISASLVVISVGSMLLLFVVV